MGGFIHHLDGKTSYVPPPQIERPKPKLNVTQLMREWAGQTKPEWIRNLGFKLGVTYQSLTSLGCAWATRYKAWAFTMFNGWGEPVGIRLRANDGSKFSVTGSHNGLFIPKMESQRLAWITEGPSDSAACITLGLFPIGRPSCNGSLDQVVIACKRLGVQRACIVSDNDTPGINGSLALQNILPIPSVVYTPPAKDFRDGIKLGLTRELIESTIRNLVWKNPQ